MSGRPPLPFDAVMILGKELRRDRGRALLELRARSAAASAALRHGVRYVVSLEAPLVGQELAGSAIVAALLDELGVPRDRMVLDEATTSTREEALEASRQAAQFGWRRLLVVTSDYHVPRARRYFDEVFATGRVSVHAPVALMRLADAGERAWIRAGSPSEAAMAVETRVEAILSNLARALHPLPASVRWQIEVAAGDALRRVARPRSSDYGAGSASAASARSSGR